MQLAKFTLYTAHLVLPFERLKERLGCAKVSIYDHNWKRIGKFSPKKVQLIRRSNKLCVV